MIKEWTKDVHTGPLITTYWHQNAPYNDYCFTKATKKKAKAGCVAIALGQIINYTRRNDPKYRKLWQKINRPLALGEKNHELSTMIHEIGKKVFMDYGEKASASNILSARFLLNTSGYRAVIKDYNYDIIKTNINNDYPVYVSANRSRKRVDLEWWIFNAGFMYTYQNGHAFVCDGYKEIDKWKTIEIDTGVHGRITKRNELISTSKYVHINWGWGISNQSDSGWVSYDYLINKDMKYLYNKQIITIEKI